MSRRLDARGLSCPIPVVLTKKALEESPEENLEVLVDNPTARENVCRLVRNLGYNVEIINSGEEFTIKIAR
ncbi:tRNA 2-thiouridine synthesizing protein A [Caldanaerovirga acetigignens]|jgi:tRNA 2-thiouridine synthesizing protein A|uniref:tRNA 2-thiouridine synthesizing protein A n=1 Tax=Caldanaerovirga acetigignens TaxID=447595 RepID=A0A1M7KM48_9FIRM|nr:sulfurtransferase TusA family protein [Caldanaerovirga acetigignens]SHM66439.1 tRNA 2-thiouridine synthesizing protein A [Caldanaerovirga acetigignens]